MFSIFRPKPFFAPKQQQQVLDAIRNAEKRTSGEIRLFIESRCRYVDAIDRAAEIFYGLKMDQTGQRNGTLLYIAFKDHQLAVFGDEGIYKKTGLPFWKEKVDHMLTHFNRENYVAGIITVVNEIGEALYQHFPYDNNTDKNELPDDIVFGK